MYIISQSSTSRTRRGEGRLKKKEFYKGGLSVASEYERRRLLRQSQVSRLDEWGVD